MLSQSAALKIAEAAAGWLTRRQPRQWLEQAIIVRRYDGSYAVVAREQSLDVLDKARRHAEATGRAELAQDIASGIDIIKATAPIDVPLIVFVERPGGVIDMGVITLSLPVETKNQA